MKLLRLLIITILSVCSCRASGAEPVLRFHNINTENGLASNAVLTIKKDSIGFIWIGTKKGLCRFDGVEINHNPLPLLRDNIWSVEEADRDTLLIGTLSDVVFFSRKSQTCDPLGLPDAVVKAICKIGTSKFWAGTENGLYLIDNHKYSRIHLSSGLSKANHITGILRQNTDVFWFSTADGLLRIDIRDLKPKLFRMQDGNNFFTCLTRDGESIYLGTFNRGIFRFNINSGQFDKVVGFDHNLVMAIDYNDNKLYVGTNGQGLKSLDPTTGKIEIIPIVENRQHTSASNTVTCLLHDNGIKWVGTQFCGVSYTPRSDYKFRHFSVPGFNSSDYHVRSMLTIEDGSKLIGTREGLFFIDAKTGRVKSFKTSDNTAGLRSDIIVSIDRIGGKIMICTFGGGVHIFDPATQSLQDFSKDEIFTYGCVFGMTEDRRGNIWLATQDGLYESSPDGKVKRVFNLMNSVLSTSVIFVAYPDKSDRIWVGTNFGLYLLDITNGHMMNDCFSEPLKGEIKYIHEDSRGDMWVGTTQDGLYQIGMDLEVKRHYTADDFLPENEVLSIAEDKRGNLWISTRSKITRFNPADQSHYVYQRPDGLNNMDFNNSVEITNDSIIAWSNEGGLIYTSLNQTEGTPHISGAPRITSVMVGDRIYNPLYMDSGEDIPVYPSDHSVIFRFSNMNFTLPYATAYEYRLEGYDKEWRLITGAGEVTYTDLNPGDYKFHIRLPGQDSLTSGPVSIHVERSYTSVILIIIGAIVAILITVILIYRIWRLKIKISNERDLFSKASKKTDDRNPSGSNPSENNQLLNELLEYMDSEKPYRNPKLSISDVTGHLGCQEKELSQLLNTSMKVNFSNFINVYRVNEVKRRLTKENLSRFTLMTIAEQCGFSSKTTFYRVFKDITGFTPLQYCQREGLEGDMGKPQ